MRPLPSLRCLLALLVPALVLWEGCKTKYVCPAYQSAFVLDLPTYKRNPIQDSIAAAADTSLDVDVIMVLAERIKKDPKSRYEFDADSVPKFPDNGVVKTDVLLIRKISRRRKDKVMATVPMITVFPRSEDSTQNGEDPDARPTSEAVPSGDSDTTPAPANQDESPAQEPPPAEKKEEDSKPF